MAMALCFWVNGVLGLTDIMGVLSSLDYHVPIYAPFSTFDTVNEAPSKLSCTFRGDGEPTNKLVLYGH